MTGADSEAMRARPSTWLMLDGQKNKKKSAAQYDHASGGAQTPSRPTWTVDRETAHSVYEHLALARLGTHGTWDDEPRAFVSNFDIFRILLTVGCTE